MCASDLQTKDDHKHMVNDSSQMEKQSWLYFMETFTCWRCICCYLSWHVCRAWQTWCSVGRSEIQTKPQNFLTLRLAPGMEKSFLIPWNTAQMSRATLRGPHHRTAQLDEARANCALLGASGETEQRQQVTEVWESLGNGLLIPEDLWVAVPGQTDHINPHSNSPPLSTQSLHPLFWY